MVDSCAVFHRPFASLNGMDAVVSDVPEVVEPSPSLPPGMTLCECCGVQCAYRVRTYES